MKTQDFILLIMNCEKYRYKAELQKVGWLKEIPSELIYFHVIGNENLDKDYIFDNENQILYVKTKDDYNSLPHKVISAYDAVSQEYNYKYILKTDDDQHLTQTDYIQKWMSDMLHYQPNYGGKLVTIAKEHISEYYHYHPELPRNVVMRKTQYCNGRFYILSKIAVDDLLSKKEVFKTEYFEDYAVGYHMDNNIKYKLLHIPNEIFIDTI